VLTPCHAGYIREEVWYDYRAGVCNAIEDVLFQGLRKANSEDFSLWSDKWRGSVVSVGEEVNDICAVSERMHGNLSANTTPAGNTATLAKAVTATAVATATSIPMLYASNTATSSGENRIEAISEDGIIGDDSEIIIPVENGIESDIRTETAPGTEVMTGSTDNAEAELVPTSGLTGLSMNVSLLGIAAAAAYAIEEGLYILHSRRWFR